MGCDIHFNIEVKTKNGWELYAKPNIARNYRLFAKLADVRNYENFQYISKPKGIPGDISYLVRKSYEYWGMDAHSATYLSSKEIVELSDWLQTKPFGKDENDVYWDSNDLEHGILHTYLEGNSFAGIARYPDESPKWIEDVRFVFWFDN